MQLMPLDGITVPVQIFHLIVAFEDMNYKAEFMILRPCIEGL